MEEKFTTRTVGDVILDWDGSEMTIWTTDNPRKQIGEFSFWYYEDADDEECARVTGMHLEGPDSTGRYLRQGIGEAILEFVCRVEGWTIVFSPDDGNRRDDGSHLTGDGPVFARAMVNKGLAFFE